MSNVQQEDAEQQALDAKLEFIAEVERQERAVAEALEADWPDGDYEDSDHPLFAPMAEDRAQAILDAVLANSGSAKPARESTTPAPSKSEAAPAPAPEAEPSPAGASVHWLRPAAIGAAFATAAAAALWLTIGTTPTTPDVEPTTVAVADYTVSQGAKVLGGNAGLEQPRHYRSSEEFFLSVQPLPSTADAQAHAVRIFAIGADGGKPAELSLPITEGDGGTIEVRGPLGPQLEPGLWHLSVQVGPSEQCARDRKSCFESNVSIYVDPD